MTKSELQQRTIKLKMAMSVASMVLDDEVALNAIAIFPIWETNSDYAVGDRVQYKAILYKCVQAHTSQSDWTPSATPALWSEVSVDECPPWKQPTGAHDAYNVGDKCTYNNEKFICTADNNIYPPDVYGWDKI